MRPARRPWVLGYLCCPSEARLTDDRRLFLIGRRQWIVEETHDRWPRHESSCYTVRSAWRLHDRLPDAVGEGSGEESVSGYFGVRREPGAIQVRGASARQCAASSSFGLPPSSGSFPCPPGAPRRQLHIVPGYTDSTDATCMYIMRSSPMTWRRLHPFASERLHSLTEPSPLRCANVQWDTLRTTYTDACELCVRLRTSWKRQQHEGESARPGQAI